MKFEETKMGKLVAHLLGKEVSIKYGKVTLSDEEKKKITQNYGPVFLEKLEAMNFDAEDQEAQAQTLFDAAVQFNVNKITKEKDTIIANLQQQVNALVEEGENIPNSVSKTSKIDSPYDINMNACHNASVSKVLSSANPMNMLSAKSSGIDIADMQKEFGSVMPPKLKLDLFVQNVYLGLPDARLFTRIQSNTDYKASSALITEVSQAFTPKWTPKGTAKFTPITIKYRRHKINVSITPADIIESWLTSMYEQGKTPAQMPITQFILKELILPQISDDITRIMLGKAKYKAISTSIQDGDNGSSAIDSMDGLETILVDDKAGSKNFNHFKAAKNPFTLKGQNLLDYVSSYVKAISPYFVNKPLVYCSEEFLEYYQAQDYSVNGKYTGTNIGNTIRFTGFSFQPIKAMYGSPILFSTPKANMVMLVDYATASNCINKVQEDHYSVHIMGEYSLSVGFKVAEAVYAAIPDDYTPSDKVIGTYPKDDDNWLKKSEETASEEGA